MGYLNWSRLRVVEPSSMCVCHCRCSAECKIGTDNSGQVVAEVIRG